MAENKEKQYVSDNAQYETIDNICVALTAFIIEIGEQTAALRAYDNVFQSESPNHIFLQRAYDSIWRELLSEIARIFDKANTGSSENCTLLRLKELCYSEEYSFLFPDNEKSNLLQSLDKLIEHYNQLPILKSRNKQLAHHDLKQVLSGECIEISLEQIEKLVEDITDVFAKIRTQLYLGNYEVSFANYNALVEQFEKDIRKLIE